MKFFYSLGVNSYVSGIRIASLWNKKAKEWVSGRKNQWKKIEEFKGENVIWFHCASLGEFEQGRPVMERLKSELNCQIVVTFFSPSGYAIQKSYEGADLVVYLPKDSKKNAIRFFNAISPKRIYFVKYEFWAAYIFEAKKRAIPIYSIAALFRKNQIFFKPHGGFMRKVLKSFDKILVQNESSKNLLSTINIDAVICGDTRFDRVFQNAQEVQSYPILKSFCGEKKVLICGSAWQEDLDVISSALSKDDDLKVIIAPHELSESIYHKIEKAIKKRSVRYSKAKGDLAEYDLMIIDNIGMLMNVYQYGDIAFVGGGFKTGLHNILEPAAFGLPVMFGPKTEKFPEAKIFKDEGIGFEISNSESFDEKLTELKSSNLKEKVLNFMDSQKGATEIILKETK